MLVEDATSVPAHLALVYFIQAREGDPIKIGRVSRADLLPARLGALQTGSPYPLHVLGVVRGHREAELHTRFAEHRLSGEWFVAATEILDFLGLAGVGAGERRESADFERGRRAGYEEGVRDGWLEAGRALHSFIARNCFFEPEHWPEGGSTMAAFSEAALGN